MITAVLILLVASCVASILTIIILFVLGFVATIPKVFWVGYRNAILIIWGVTLLLLLATHTI